MKCAVFLLSISLLATVTPTIVHQIEAVLLGKVYRIGYLSVRGPEREKGYLRAFRQGLRDLGYFDGKNIAIKYRWAAGSRERLPALAAELLSLRVKLIVTGGGEAARAAQGASETIPIVMAEATAPVARGLVQSLAQPGGNTTGLSGRSPEVFGKLLELLKETVPNLTRVAVLWTPKSPDSKLGWNSIQLPARQLGLQLHSMEVRSPNDLDKAFHEAKRARVRALVVTPDLAPRLGTSWKRIAALAVTTRLPAISTSTRFLGAGGLITYNTRMADQYRRAAAYVDKILKGANPADLPVELPTKYRLRINLETAKQLGLAIPPEILIRATKVIK